MELLGRFLSGTGLGHGGHSGGEGSRNSIGSDKGEVAMGMEPRLVDYELLLGEDGKRCVGFGWFAGGMSSVVFEFPYRVLSSFFISSPFM